jgi:hypothetical protein
MPSDAYQEAELYQVFVDETAEKVAPRDYFAGCWIASVHVW